LFREYYGCCKIAVRNYCHWKLHSNRHWHRINVQLCQRFCHWRSYSHIELCKIANEYYDCILYFRTLITYYCRIEREWDRGYLFRYFAMDNLMFYNLLIPANRFQSIRELRHEWNTILYVKTSRFNKLHRFSKSASICLTWNSAIISAHVPSWCRGRFLIYSVGYFEQISGFPLDFTVASGNFETPAIPGQLVLRVVFHFPCSSHYSDWSVTFTHWHFLIWYLSFGFNLLIKYMVG